MKKYLDEVEKKLIRQGKTAEKPKYPDLQKYIGTQYQVSGLDVWSMRKIYKEGFSFTTANAEEQFEIWDFIWKNAALFDAMSLCLFFADKHVKNASPSSFWNTIKQWQKKTDNWAHSDELSVINAYLLEAIPEKVFPQLKQWNLSKNPWDRRQSIVSLLAYKRFRKKILPFEQLIPLVEKLLADPDHFVQKGVGWTLRELYLAYPTVTLQFMKKHFAEITSTAFAAASEKLKPADKEKLKALRKKKK